MTMDPDNQIAPQMEAAPVADLVPSLLRFMRIVHYRKNVLIGTICVAALLGAAYLVVATRYYQSSSKLLIIQQNRDHLATVGDHDTSDNTMATHRGLVVSPVVLRAAIDNLAPEHRIDFF